MAPAVVRTMIVGNLMRQWPQTIRVFVRRRMRCPGCPMAPFVTVSEAAAEHGIAADGLVRELLDAMAAGAPTSATPADPGREN